MALMSNNTITVDVGCVKHSLRLLRYQLITFPVIKVMQFIYNLSSNIGFIMWEGS